MIPKIIHFCWLSGEPFPPEIQRCIDSWHQMMPDYELWLWDTQRFDIKSTTWTQQAFNNKKYAFAADYIRLYALYRYGGIYLDSDVLVYKRFDELLSLPYFVGCDQVGAFEAAVIGAEKECKWIGDVLQRYDGRNFVRSDGSFDMMELPIVFHHRLTDLGYTFRKLHSVEPYSADEKQLLVFDRRFFNGRDHIGVHPTPLSFCSHNYAGSWIAKSQDNFSLARSLKGLMPRMFVNLMSDLLHHTCLRNKFKSYTIPFRRG